MIADALKNRTDLQEQSLVLQNQRAEPQNSAQCVAAVAGCVCSLRGPGAGRPVEPRLLRPSIPTTHPPDYPGALGDAFNNTQPEYQVGFQLSVPIRNRAAKADQYRAELEYRQSQVGLEEARKRILIEVRNARYALEQGASRVDAARKARDLAQRTLDIMQKEQQLGAGSNQQTLERRTRPGRGRVRAGHGRDGLRKSAHRSEARHRLHSRGIRNFDRRRKNRRSGGEPSLVRKKKSEFWSPTINPISSRP